MADNPQSAEIDFEGLVRDQQSSLRAFIYSLGVDANWVDDLAQDVFVVAYRELDSYEDDRDFGKWLRGIARNLVRNEMRKQGRRKRILHEGLSEHLTILSQDEEQANDDAKLSALRDCIEQLPDRSRKLIHSRYYGGWDATVLANRFKMKAATVRQTLLRIRRQLYQCISQH